VEIVIIIPLILTDVLRKAAPAHAAVLSLDFGAHVFEVCHGILSPDEEAACLGYIEAARAVLSGDGTVGQLRVGYIRYAETQRNEGRTLAARIRVMADLAVCVGCQREMEAAGITRRQKYGPDILAIATDAQSVVGLWAKEAPTPGEAADGQFVRVVKWEEARWQLVKAIETAPLI
jgi:hypothetical protein